MWSDGSSFEACLKVLRPVQYDVTTRLCGLHYRQLQTRARAAGSLSNHPCDTRLKRDGPLRKWSQRTHHTCASCIMCMPTASRLITTLALELLNCTTHTSAGWSYAA